MERPSFWHHSWISISPWNCSSNATIVGRFLGGNSLLSQESLQPFAQAKKWNNTWTIAKQKCGPGKALRAFSIKQLTICIEQKCDFLQFFIRLNDIVHITGTWHGGSVLIQVTRALQPDIHALSALDDRALWENSGLHIFSNGQQMEAEYTCITRVIRNRNMEHVHSNRSAKFCMLLWHRSKYDSSTSHHLFLDLILFSGGILDEVEELVLLSFLQEIQKAFSRHLFSRC